ncbi:ATG18 [Mytilus edulis]|uniref:WIPI1_2 n=1 Tax=Mytilus edulis TaxID=6550 RepID=A0A8S3ST07_MYTED|nr:ATG18 [Mytilus edulis]
MNLAIRSGDHPSDLLFVNFNQDCTSLAVGSKSWYRLYSLNTVDKLESIYESESEDVCIVERLFSSSLVAIVSISSPRKLKVCHFKKGTEICNYSYSNSILAVKLNRQRLIVCLEERLCALSINNDNCFLAYPGSNQIGEVQIFDTINLRAVTMIPAHDNPLAAIAFNAQGNRVATASEKGTVIRVFSVPDGQKLFEFRRGVKRCATIYSLAFSVDSMFLAASSSTETVHVFKLETPKDNKTEEAQGWMGYFGQALKTSANYLPTQVTELFHQGRAFATARLPSSGLINVCALSVIQKIPRLLVASQDGYLYIFNLDPTDSNECVLVRQHRLDGLTGDSHVTEVTPYDKPLTHQQSTTSYASTVKKPEATVGAGSNMAPPDSEPYQEMDQGATGGEDLKGLGQLRLDDDNEFPPMTHKND